MSRAAVKMTAEHLGRLLGLFTRKRRLPAAVEARRSEGRTDRASGRRREADKREGDEGGETERETM